jgi:murein DD-endopeptidase MepM/ murein hydrolase activator NlpD
MDIRIRHDFSRGLILALVLPAFLAGCASTPRTSFDWGVNTRFHHRTVHRTYVASRSNYTYRNAPTYQDTSTRRVVPTPRPEPGWYQDSARRAPPRVADNDTPPPTNAVMQFAWPMKGRVLANFGSTSGGERNDGINIAASYGDPIHAAADGTISYSGNDLKSYGNLVLIRHGDNYVTAYAHVERILVNRGDHVAKGQVIAYAGSTGDVSQPQLHFEIRRGVQPVNPRPLLGPLQVALR